VDSEFHVQSYLYVLQTEPHTIKLCVVLNLEFSALVYPAIGDAVDEDGSGYVSVYEVNRFFRRKPEGWTSPQWIA
jgi:hypothetical protein